MASNATVVEKGTFAEPPKAEVPVTNPPLIYVAPTQVKMPSMSTSHAPMKTPSFIQEGVAGSHVDVWKSPVFNKWIMFFFTLLFGNFGLHYVMLRAPMIAMIFIIVNSLTWGYWYWYDLIQLAFTSEDDLNLHGMGSPFLFQFAVAVGMWTSSSRNPGTVPTQPGTVPPQPGTVPPQPGVVPTQPGTVPTQPGVVPPQPGTVPELKTQEGGGGPTKVLGEPRFSDRVAGFVEKFLKWIIGPLTPVNPRKPLRPMMINENKVIENPFIHSILVFLILLFAPIGAISSALAGDMMGAVLHVFDPLMFITFFLNIVKVILNPMKLFMVGMDRPPFWTYFNFGFEDFGQSVYLQMARVPSTEEIENLTKTPIGMMKDGADAAAAASTVIPLVGIGKAASEAASAAIQTAKGAANLSEARALKASAEAEEIKARTRVQRGGYISKVDDMKGNVDSFSLGVIGAVLAGGFLLGVSRNGIFQGKDDSPPNTGRV